LIACPHPAFQPYRDLLAQLGGSDSLDALNAASERINARHAHTGQALRFAASAEAPTAAQYEQAIAASGVIPTRENNRHDFLNALVWLRFPQLKSALNLRHCLALEQQPAEHKQRGRLRDQLTLLDESGMLVASSTPGLLTLLGDKSWVELFWDARAQVLRHMQFIVVGHGLLEKCLAPFPAMTAKCLCLSTAATGLEALDELAAACLRDAASLQLPPLPVQGVPGWDDNGYRAYYQNTAVFRVPVRTPPPAA
jgi:hypothetical protein